jgi:MoaA/NifB/PqqE/SkfB family radical SAM enzyme
MQGVLRDIAEMGVKAVTFSGGGEPLMYPHIVPTMQSILDSKIDLSIITNGHLLSAERAEVLSHAKWVRFSFDASRAETYSLIRKIPLAAHGVVCGNMENFAKIKNPQCELGVNFVINHENFAEILEAAELVKSLGANHIKFSARITKDLHEYHAHFKDKAIELVHKAKDLCADKRFKVINKYEEDFDTAMVFHRTYKKCYIKDVFTVIAADSKVYFCHDKAYVSTGVVGDLSKMGFKELWYSPEVIKRYEEFDACEECNHHCVFDDRNMMLNSYFDMDMNHVNFI